MLKKKAIISAGNETVRLVVLKKFIQAINLQELNSCVEYNHICRGNFLTLTLSQEKLSAIIEQCQLFFARGQVLMRENSQLIGRLCYSADEFFLASIYCRSLKRKQILELLTQQEFRIERLFDLEELLWRIVNLKLSNEKSLVTAKPQLTIALDVSMKGCGTFYKSIKQENLGQNCKRKNK